MNAHGSERNQIFSLTEFLFSFWHWIVESRNCRIGVKRAARKEIIRLIKLLPKVNPNDSIRITGAFSGKQANSYSISIVIIHSTEGGRFDTSDWTRSESTDLANFAILRTNAIVLIEILGRPTNSGQNQEGHCRMLEKVKRQKFISCFNWLSPSGRINKWLKWMIELSLVASNKWYSIRNYYCLSIQQQ